MAKRRRAKRWSGNGGASAARVARGTVRDATTATSRTRERSAVMERLEAATPAAHAAAIVVGHA